MSEESVPFGGENIPFRDMEGEGAEKPPVQPVVASVPGQKPNLVIPALAGVVIILLIAIGVLLWSKFQSPPPVIIPSPSPIIISPSPESSASAVSLKDKIDAFESGLRDVDLSQTELSFPHVDFQLNIVKNQQ